MGAFNVYVPGHAAGMRPVYHTYTHSFPNGVNFSVKTVVQM